KSRRCQPTVCPVPQSRGERKAPLLVLVETGSVRNPDLRSVDGDSQGGESSLIVLGAADQVPETVGPRRRRADGSADAATRQGRVGGAAPTRWDGTPHPNREVRLDAFRKKQPVKET